jgi:hypothetical protein
MPVEESLESGKSARMQEVPTPGLEVETRWRPLRWTAGAASSDTSRRRHAAAEPVQVKMTVDSQQFAEQGGATKDEHTHVVSGGGQRR